MYFLKREKKRRKKKEEEEEDDDADGRIEDGGELQNDGRGGPSYKSTSLKLDASTNAMNAVKADWFHPYIEGHGSATAGGQHCGAVVGVPTETEPMPTATVLRVALGPSTAISF